MPADEGHRRTWLVIAAAALLTLSLLGLSHALWTPDEPREAEIAREMYLRPGVIPTLNGDRFLEKPPLYYWAVAATFRVAGAPSATAARAVSALAGLATLLVVAVWATRASSATIAGATAAMLATSVQLLVSTHWVLIDPLLMLFCALAAWAGWEAVRDGSPRFVALLYGSLTLALWTKGLIGPVLVSAGLLAYCVLEGKQKPWRRLRPFIGATVLALGLLALAGAIYLEGGRQALWEWGWVNHVQRFLDPHATGHRQPFWYYLKALPVAVLPWLVAFLGVFRRAAWRDADEEVHTMRYCAALVSGALLVLTLSATKRETYLLPLLPPLFLLITLALARQWPELSSTRVGRALVGAQAGLLALLSAAPTVAVMVYTRAIAPGPALFLAVAVAVAAVLLVLVARRDLPRAAAWALAAAFVTAASTLVLVPPVIDREKDLEPFVASFGDRLGPGEPVYVLGVDETLLGIVPFVTGRKVVALRPEQLGGPREGAGTLPRLLLLQSDGKELLEPAVAARYEREEVRRFGPRRTLSLWRLK